MKKNPNWKSVNVNVKVIFVQTHVYRHTQHTLTQTFGSWQLHMCLGEDSWRAEKEWRGEQGSTRGWPWCPLTLSHTNTLSPFMCNIYDFIHRPNQLVLHITAVCCAWPQNGDKQSVTSEVKCTMASIKCWNRGAPKLSPVVLFLKRLSYFTDLVKMTCLLRQKKKPKTPMHLMPTGFHFKSFKMKIKD